MEGVEEESIEREQSMEISLDGISHEQDFKPAPDSTVNVSSTIMLKVPTANLAPLREIFEAGVGGLNLRQFLKAFIQNMVLENDEELLQIIPDLVDFFNLVDINGDEHMEWSEFVMFVIEQVLKGTSTTICEKLETVCKNTIAKPSSRKVVQCSKFVPELNKIVLGIGPELQLYDTVENSPNWLTEGLKIKLKKKPPKSLNMDEAEHLTMAKERGIVQDNDERGSLEVVDLCYIGSMDLLVVCRSDYCFEFNKFASRSKLSAEFIMAFGLYETNVQYNRIAVRDYEKESIRLFAAGANSIVFSWTLHAASKIGPVVLRDPKELHKHDDFVQDLLIIHNDMYNLLVTAGLDKKIHLWDLHTLQYKTTRRSGILSGLQCVAFDGKSILFAGGFDFKIVAYDLDAEIDKPLFQLPGHSATIMKIVPLGHCDRAMSLDASGEIRLWDISRSSTSDKEERLIDTIPATIDHVRNFDVMLRKPSQFPTLYGLIIVAHGRGQHVYRVLDTSVKESPPLCALLSVPLMLTVTVHSKEVIFWDVVTGEESARLDNLGGTSADVLSAVLDNRSRKVITGDSAGLITVYNCLTGAKLKQLPRAPSAIRYLLYSPDKTVIAVGGAGDIFIYDDLSNDELPSDALLRECRAHDVDIISIAYSHSFGLIATADCQGCVVVLDYQYLTLEVVIKDFVGTEIGQICFLEPYPLLLIADHHHNFTIIPVGPAMSKPGQPRLMYSVVTIAQPPMAASNTRRSFMESLGLDGSMPGSDDNSVASSIASAARAMEGKGGGPHVHARRLSMGGIKASFQDMSSSFVSAGLDTTTLGGGGGSEVDEELTRANVNYKKKRRYLSSRNEIKAVALHYVPYRKGEAFTSTTGFTVNYAGLDGASSTDSFNAGHDSIVPPGEDLDDNEPQYIEEQEEEMCLILGHEDGTVSVVDLYETVLAMGVKPIPADQFVTNQPGYDPRKMTAFKLISTQFQELEKVTYTYWEVENCQRYTASLQLMFNAHKSPIHSIGIVGDGFDILTSGEDCCVNLFSMSGNPKGVLTRGRENDQLFKPRWLNPIDMNKREVERRKDAVRLIRKLHLKRQPKKIINFFDPFIDHATGARSATPGNVEERLASKRGNAVLQHSQTAKVLLSEITMWHEEEAAREAEKTKLEKVLHTDLEHLAVDVPGAKPSSSQSNRHSAAPSKTSKKSHHRVREPDRVLVLEQLHGAMNYELSTKDASALEMQAKALALTLKEEARTKHRNKAKKAEPHSAAQYLTELMKGCELVKPPKETVIPFDKTGNRNNKTKFEIEIEHMNVHDDKNWEIASKNRQRQLYSNMYDALDKYHADKNPMKMWDDALRQILPAGVKTVHDFMEMIRRSRKGARAAFGRLHGGGQHSLTSSNLQSMAGTATGHLQPVPELPLEGASSGKQKGPVEASNEHFPPLWEPKYDLLYDRPLEPGALTGNTINVHTQFPVNTTLYHHHDPVAAALEANRSTKQRFKLTPSLRTLDVPVKYIAHTIEPNPKLNPLSRSMPQFPFSCSEDKDAAATEHKQIASALREFESSVKGHEKMYRRARKEVRKNKRQIKQSAKHGTLEPLSPHHMLRNTGVRQRLTTQSSIGDLMALSRAKLHVDETIERKMNFAMEYRNRMVTSLDLTQHGHVTKGPSEHDLLHQKNNPLHIHEPRHVGHYHRDHQYHHGHSLHQRHTAKHSHTELQNLLHHSKGESAGVEGIVPIAGTIAGKVPVIDKVDDTNRTDYHRRSSILAEAEAANSYQAYVNLKEIYELRETEDNEDTDSLCLSLNVGSVHSLNSILKDANDKTALYLVKLLNHKLIRTRPQFLYALMQMLDKRIHMADHIMHKNEVTVSLSEVLYCLRPYMNEREKKNSTDFLRENLEYCMRDEVKNKAERNRVVSEEEMNTLRALFSFFDRDHSGTIEASELKHVLNTTLLNKTKNGSFIYPEGKEDGDMDGRSLMEIMTMVGTTKTVIGFDEFVMLFKNTLIPPEPRDEELEGSRPGTS